MATQNRQKSNAKKMKGINNLILLVNLYLILEDSCLCKFINPKYKCVCFVSDHREELSVVTTIVINPVTQYEQYLFACNGYDLDNRN